MLKSIALLLALAAGCASAPPPAPAQPQPQSQPPPPTQPQEQPAPHVKDIVQPVKIEKVDPQADDGEEGGVEGGVVGGYAGDAPPPPPPPPPPPAPSQVVSPTLLEGQRVAGSKLIAPDAKTRTAIARSGKTRVVATFKLCVDDTGAVARVVLIKSSGFPDYDALIRSTITGTWQYSPYVVDGQPRPVCTAVTFIYDQH
jgi:protein TonB